jgi:hypothetical protein
MMTRVILSVFSSANYYSTAEGDVIASSRYCEIKGTIANNLHRLRKGRLTAEPVEMKSRVDRMDIDRVEAWYSISEGF